MEKKNATLPKNNHRNCARENKSKVLWVGVSLSDSRLGMAQLREKSMKPNTDWLGGMQKCLLAIRHRVMKLSALDNIRWVFCYIFKL